MKRIRITAICVSLLATLSMVGCVCTPGYHSGVSRYGCHSGNIGYDGGCDPCGAAESGCGVIEYGGNPCAPSKIVDCRNCLSNIGNGICLIGRGVLDATATPFIAIGGVLSSGCRYEVLAHCDNTYYGNPCYQTQSISSPCAPCDPVCTSGCETCAGGYSEGIQYSTNVSNRAAMFPPRRNNAIIQASYQEPTAPAVRFVQPR